MLSQPIPNHSLDSKPHDPGHDTTSHSTDHQLNQLPSTAFVVVFGSTDRVTVNGHRQYGTRQYGTANTATDEWSRLLLVCV